MDEERNCSSFLSKDFTDHDCNKRTLEKVHQQMNIALKDSLMNLLTEGSSHASTVQVKIGNEDEHLP